MTEIGDSGKLGHSHVFLGAEHEANERRTWAVIILCGAMMVAEIVGGLIFGSIALVADGIHMSTHAGALLLAALAYSYARRHAYDPRFTLGTGKLGDLAGFSSALVLAMISLLIAYEAIGRLFAPVPINFAAAIPVAALGLAVNVASAWLLSGGHTHDHGHGHGRGDAHGHEGHPHDGGRRIATAAGAMVLEIFEDGVPPRFRLRAAADSAPASIAVTIETVRPDGARQLFAMADCGDFLESRDEIPEPHAFEARIRIGMHDYRTVFDEHEHAHDAAVRDNNMRAAIVHVIADATVSVLVIAGLVLGRLLGWPWMDPLVGIIGAVVIASWAYSLVRAAGAVLLDMTPDMRMAENLRTAIENDGDKLADLHLWRLGPGHLGAILSVMTDKDRNVAYYRGRLARFRSLSHLTIEVQRF